MVTEVEARPLLSGAGGYWQVIDEVASTMVIQQQDSLSYNPACAVGLCWPLLSKLLAASFSLFSPFSEKLLAVVVQTVVRF